MATYCGTGGYFWAPTLEINIRSWSITLTAAVATGGHSSSGGWLDGCLGMKGWTASAEVYCDTTLAATPPFVIGDDVAFQFSDGERAFDGSALITDVTYTCDIEGGALVSSSISMQGYAELVISDTDPA